MQIADLKIDPPVLLAPMAGVSDYPYRQIVREMGCKLLYTEMISSKGLVYGSKKTEALIDFTGLTAVQLFGEDPEIMAQAARIIAKEYQPAIIDINMGCPTPKITKSGAGAALMKNPSKVFKIINKVVQAVDIPVTVKIRKGWAEDQLNAVEIARIAEDAGAQAIAVHGRSREAFYSGKADWGIIREVKNSVQIPVLGNGDIFTPEDALAMLRTTNCDGVMIGRGAQGNPWLIKRTIHYLRSGELLPEPSYQERVSMALQHLERAIDYYGLERAVPLMRKHISWYLKGMPRANKVKEKVNRLQDYEASKKVLEEYQAELEQFQDHFPGMVHGMGAKEKN